LFESASGRGRPRGRDSQGRTRELLGHLADGRSLRDAARLARVKPDRVLRLLERDDFWAAVSALRTQR
jgi:hypothetical protein